MSRTSNKRRMADLLCYGILILVCGFVLAPLVWNVLTSLKTVRNMTAFPPQWIPDPVTFEHYVGSFLSSRMPQYLWNTSYVALATILFTLLVATPAGYATARFAFSGKGAVLFAILATSMIPGIAVLVPYYVISTRVGLFDSHVALIIIYTAWQVPAVTWIMRAFFESVPKELDEAALVDGCSRWQAFYRIVLPAARPGLGASAVLVLLYVWDEFIISYTLTLTTGKRLLTTGLYFTVTELGVDWGKLTASVTVALLPIMVFFLLAQRQFIQGLTAGSTKG